MQIEPIEYNGGVIWVDKEAHILENDWCINKNQDTLYQMKGIRGEERMFWHKIFAQSPNLSIPNIPYVEVEEDVEQLAFEAMVDYKPFDITCDNYRDYARFGYVKGYKAVSTKKWSNDDFKVFALSLFGFLKSKPDSVVEDLRDFTISYLKSLQQKIKSIEIEMKQKMTVRGNADCWNEYIDIPDTYQKENKTFLKVKKINY